MNLFKEYNLNCKGFLISTNKPLVMGIINLTPDSFFSGSRASFNDATQIAETMYSQGATIVDLGGQSTRPGAEIISAQQEMDRVVPAVEAIAAAQPELIISIDTFNAAVAKAALNAGAHIVNDISAGIFDAEMLQTVALAGAPFIAMHMQGQPLTMQLQPHYDNLMLTLTDFFIERISACHKAGISDVMLDPGFGFGKTIEHNYHILKHLHELAFLNKPILVGVSRKSMIYKYLQITAEQALPATSGVHMLALQQGAGILRVHDVPEAVQAIALHQLYNNA